jgi:hypothetical protein
MIGSPEKFPRLDDFAPARQLGEILWMALPVEGNPPATGARSTAIVGPNGNRHKAARRALV